MNKREIIRINVSSSFVARARCKKCGSGPEYYYNGFKDISYRDHNRQKQRHMPFKRITKFSYHPLSVYRPLMHNHRAISSVHDNWEYYEEVLCRCQKTKWSLKQKLLHNRRDITDKKGRMFYKLKMFNYGYL